MNPWAIGFIVLGFVLLIIGAKGTQDNVIAMLKGKAYGNSTVR